MCFVFVKNIGNKIYLGFDEKNNYNDAPSRFGENGIFVKSHNASRQTGVIGNKFSTCKHNYLRAYNIRAYSRCSGFWPV